jgi:hypothetical protein
VICIEGAVTYRQRTAYRTSAGSALELILLITSWLAAVK